MHICSKGAYYTSYSFVSEFYISFANHGIHPVMFIFSFRYFKRRGAKYKRQHRTYLSIFEEQILSGTSLPETETGF